MPYETKIEDNDDFDYIRDLEMRYDELIYAVQSKHPNETRHETALRYIREREKQEGTGKIW